MTYSINRIGRVKTKYIGEFSPSGMREEPNNGDDIYIYI